MNYHSKLKAIGRACAAALFCTYTVLPGVAFAAGDSTGNSAKKTETVYVFSKADGNVKNITVSDWLENSDKYDLLSDASSLSDIKNTEGDETYTTGADGAMTWNANGNDIYYQGATSEQPPVGMKVTYLLDGVEVSPDSLVGASGKVTIRFEFTNNSITNGVHTPFLVVTGALMDNDKFSNISIDNGRTINDGDRTYVIGVALPGMQSNLGTGADVVDIPEGFEITADASDFQLETTATVVTSDLFSDVDTSSFDDLDINGQMQLLEDSMMQIVDGASSLDSGLHTLADGADSLADGADALAAGTGQLSDGADSLSSGADQLAAGTYQLAQQTANMPAQTQALAAGAGQVNSGLAALRAGTEQAVAGLQEAQGAVQTANSYLDDANKAFGSETLASDLAAIGGTARTAADAAGTAQSAAGSALQAAGTIGGAADAKSSISDADTSAQGTVNAIDGISATAKVDGTDKAVSAVVNALEKNGTSVDDDTRSAIESAISDNVQANATVTGRDAAEKSAQETKDKTEKAVNSLSSVDTSSADSLQTDAKNLGDDAKTLGVYAQQIAGMDLSRNAVTKLATDIGHAQAYLKGADNGLSQVIGSTQQGTGLSGALYSIGDADTQNTLLYGSNAVAQGTSQLAAAAPALVSGVGQLDSGAQGLDSGAQTLADGTHTLDSGAQTLADGSHTLASGAQTAATGCDTLVDGLNQFNEQGIQKLVDAFGSVGDLTENLKSTVDAGKTYNNFSGIHPDTQGSVKFIYETDAIGDD